MIKKSGACSPAFLITLPSCLTTLERPSCSKLCPKSIYWQHRFCISKYILLTPVLMKSAPLKPGDRPLSTAQWGKRSNALQVSRVCHWKHSALLHDSPRKLPLHSAAKCRTPSHQCMSDYKHLILNPLKKDQQQQKIGIGLSCLFVILKHRNFHMDFGQWLVVTPSCDVFKLDKMQVQISKCSNLLPIQPWNLLCTG